MKSIIKSLSAVQGDLAAAGISKNQTNTFDNYKFRGIDDVLNSLAPILAKHGVLIVPSVTSSEIRTVPTANGKTMNHCKAVVEYTLYDESGESITHSFVGEGMDRGDKSVNKACTAAFKYFLFEAFCIPVEGTPDADSESHEVAEKTLEDWKKELATSIDAINAALDEGDLFTAAECWFELTEEEKQGIWAAPTKGGPFSTAHREIMKSSEFRKAYYGDKAA